MKKIPLVGQIACGEPITAEENIEDYVTSLHAWHADFALKCIGDSMEPKIKDGDIVAQIMELTNNEKVDRVIIAGGTESTINDAYRMVKCGGNISNIAGYDFSKEFHLTVADAGCLVNHVTLTGRLCAGGRYRLENLMAPIKNGRLDPTLLITHELHGFDKIEDGFRMMDELKTPDTIKPIVII